MLNFFQKNKTRKNKKQQNKKVTNINFRIQFSSHNAIIDNCTLRIA